MASSGVLIDDVAAAFALPPGTITTYMQRLREHHMLHSRGRGVNAEPMEPSDASALLAAMLAGDTIAQAPGAALDALAMPRIAYGFIHRTDENGDTGAETSAEDESHTGTFGAALRRLIFAAERYCRLGSDAEIYGIWEALFRQADNEDHHLHHDFANRDLSDVFRPSEPPRIISGYIQPRALARARGLLPPGRPRLHRPARPARRQAFRVRPNSGTGVFRMAERRSAADRHAHGAGQIPRGETSRSTAVKFSPSRVPCKSRSQPCAKTVDPNEICARTPLAGLANRNAPVSLLIATMCGGVIPSTAATPPTPRSQNFAPPLMPASPDTPASST